jgi:hypothetical protein
MGKSRSSRFVSFSWVRPPNRIRATRLAFLASCLGGRGAHIRDSRLAFTRRTDQDFEGELGCQQGAILGIIFEQAGSSMRRVGCDRMAVAAPRPAGACRSDCVRRIDSPRCSRQHFLVECYGTVGKLTGSVDFRTVPRDC